MPSTVTGLPRIVVAQYGVWAMPWASPLSLQTWDGVNQGEGLPRVVTIGSCER